MICIPNVSQKKRKVEKPDKEHNEDNEEDDEDDNVKSKSKRRRPCSCRSKYSVVQHQSPC